MPSFQIDINDFSDGQINNTNPQEPKWEGSGIFDVIIKAANENIKIQHKTSRITGAEYAEVYLGTMQSAISEAMKFLLVKEITEKDIALKEVDIANNTIAGQNLIKQGTLLEEQIKTSYTDRTLKEVEITNNTIAGENLIKQGTLLEEQIKTSYTDRTLKEVEITKNTIASENLTKEGALLDNQLEMSNVDVLYKEPSTLKDLEIKDKQIDSAVVEITNNTIAGENLIKQGTLLEEQIKTSYTDRTLKEVEITNNTIAGENLTKEGALLEEQIKTSYTDRVMKDKQTAMLGMDGVMKKQNLITGKDVVYTPKYII